MAESGHSSHAHGHANLKALLASGSSRRGLLQATWPILFASVVSTPAVLAADVIKPCTDGNPHCFSSVAGKQGKRTPSWLVEPFKYSKSTEDAYADLKKAVAAYPPGQRGIDFGGVKVVGESVAGDTAYLKVLFKARRGYIDDMEFSLKQGVCDVRTSSRDGALDFGVNAKRYNWFVDRLGATGSWETKPLLSKGHEEYFILNSVDDDDMKG